MNGEIILHKHKTGEVYQKASELLINYIKLYHNITQETLLLLSGGSAVELYKSLTEFIKESDLDWKFLRIAQVDERFFGTFNNDDINAHQVEKTGLWEVCKKKKIPYLLISQEGTLSDSTKEYNKNLEKLFKECVYKIAVLGIGDDGHTAGLLPGYKRVWNTANLVAGYKNLGRFNQRITITPKAIRMLDQVIVMAVGEKKRNPIKHLTFNIKQTTEEMKMDEFPAIILRVIPQVDRFVDREE